MAGNVYSIRITSLKLPHFTPQLLQQAYSECGPAFVGAIRKWYASKPESFFDGPEHPESRARSYMRGIIAGWAAGERGGTATALHAVFMGANPDGVFYGLRLHQLGGTVTAKSAAALTIPITPQAHGLRAREYAATVGHKLFRIRRKDSSKADLLAWAENGVLHPAYALRSSATIPSLRERRGYDALPSDTELREMARDVLNKWLQSYLTL